MKVRNPLLWAIVPVFLGTVTVLFAEDYISLGNAYAPPEKGRGSGGGWVSPPGLFGGIGFGGFGYAGGINGGGGGFGESYGYPPGDQTGGTGFPSGQIPPGYPIGPGFQTSPGVGASYGQLPELSKDCIYSNVIQGLGTPGSYSQNGQQNIQPTQGDVRSDRTLNDANEASMAKLEAERNQSRFSSQMEMQQLEARRRDLEKERNAIQFSSQAGASPADVQARIAEIDQRLTEIGFEQGALRERMQDNEYFYESRRFKIGNQVAETHPVLRSIYRNQDAIAGDGSLKPFVKELVSYVGFSAGGPAGLVIGSTVATLLGGSIDRVIENIKKVLSKPQPRLEELVPLLQEVCRWRKFNQDVARTLLNETDRDARRGARESVLERLEKAESQVRACSQEAPRVSAEIEKLDSLVQTINNRIKQGKTSLKADWALLEGLSIPEDVKEKLRKTEDASVQGLLSELNRARLSRSQFVRAYSADAVQINLGLLSDIRRTVEGNMGNLSPEDSLQLQMILQSSANRLKGNELDLQRKVVDVLRTERDVALEKIKETYKDRTPALTSALVEVELPYIRAMRSLHERHEALQKESAAQEISTLRLLEEEKRLLGQAESRSPLKMRSVQADEALDRRVQEVVRESAVAPVSDFRDASKGTVAPPPDKRSKAACSADQLSSGCRVEKKLFGVIQRCVCSSNGT